MLGARRILGLVAVGVGVLGAASAPASAQQQIAAVPFGLGAAAPPPAAGSFDLAVRYEHGEGVAQDYGRALALYCQAAESKDARAYQNLGWMFLNGRGVARDDAVAVGWLRKAAAAGSPQAANLLRTLAGIAPSAQDGCPVHAVAVPVKPVAAPPEIRAMVQKIAPKIGVEVNLVMAVISAESDFDPRAVSPKNAMGLMQLMPDTAARFGVRDPFDPAENIRGGTAYLHWLLARFSGNLTLALAAYNAGETTVDSYGGVPPYDETIQYIEKIRQHYRIDVDPRP
ncbi:MAG TPA: transglycosylase SLT domain-containing protein [Candidatus Sulfotelmatobacter sp.]|nr:transglycosylase SLT domain-containing protein [Candidatus Sulfotelmatobacter sp.]